MTKIQRDHPVIRETEVLHQGRPIIIELHPGFAVFRTKGTKQKWSLGYDSLMLKAVTNAVEQERAKNPKRKIRVKRQTALSAARSGL